MIKSISLSYKNNLDIRLKEPGIKLINPHSHSSTQIRHAGSINLQMKHKREIQCLKKNRRKTTPSTD